MPDCKNYTDAIEILNPPNTLFLLSIKVFPRMYAGFGGWQLGRLIGVMRWTADQTLPGDCIQRQTASATLLVTWPSSDMKLTSTRQAEPSGAVAR